MSLNISFGNQNVGLDMKSRFISDYGQYSQSYSYLDPLGKQKFNTQWPYLVLVIGIILSIITFIAASPEKDPKTGQLKERTGMQKFYYGLAWLCVLCSVFGAGYGVYLYFAIYLPEYYKWFETLPSEAKGKLAMISTIDQIEANNRAEQERINNNRQNNRF